MADAGAGWRKRRAGKRQCKVRRMVALRCGKWTNSRHRATPAKAIGHPLRRKILRLLQERGEPLSPISVALALEGPLGRIAYHVHVLRALGAVEPVNDEQTNSAIENFYESRFDDAPSIETLLEELGEEDDESE
jgi:DNA-binding transcriptional ArsR family regulator